MNSNEPINGIADQLSDEQRDWIERMLLDLREGIGSISETAKLRDLLLGNREARQVYLRFNQLDCQLGAASPDVHAFTKKPLIHQALRRFRPAHLISALAGAGIAAAAMLMLTINTANQEPEVVHQAHEPNIPVASLYSDYDAQFSGDTALSNNAFEKGALSLDRGIAQLAFRNGAQIVLDGKCGFEIIDEMTVVLTHGKMWAYCPPEAYGFKVLTPGGREVIDLGTEFGVEVSPQGKTTVHVFDGLVNVVGPQSGSQEITAGHAIQWNQGSSKTQSKPADYDKFVTSDDLAQTRLRAQHAQMLKRDDLLLYYDFHNIKGNQILNKAPDAAASSHGKIIGANQVSGRFNPDGALQFEHDGSRVQFQLERPMEVSQFTIALWVKFDRFTNRRSTLINSNGTDAGGVHFQVTRSGNLQSGLMGGNAFESPSNSITKGQWSLLAVSWDLPTQQATFYCNGKRLTARPRNNGIKKVSHLNVQFRDCQIGTWDKGTYSENGVRDFKGRIDEVMIFNHALSEQELAELFIKGKP